MAKSTRRARDEGDEDEEEDEKPIRRKRPRDEAEESDELPVGTPTTYAHEDCKGKTVMPSEVIAEYLDNPFELGEEPTTTCKRCKDDVPWRDCYWEETKQNLYEYLDDMRAEMVISGNDPRPDKPGFNWLIPIIGLVLGGAAGAGVGTKAGSPLILGIGGGAAIAAGWMFIDRAKNVKASEEWNRKLVSRYFKRHPEAKPKSKKRPR